MKNTYQLGAHKSVSYDTELGEYSGNATQSSLDSSRNESTVETAWSLKFRMGAASHTIDDILSFSYQTTSMTYRTMKTFDANDIFIRNTEQKTYFYNIERQFPTSGNYSKFSPYEYRGQINEKEPYFIVGQHWVELETRERMNSSLHEIAESHAQEIEIDIAGMMKIDVSDNDAA